MEVREIVETVIKEPLLEVRFRMSTDTDEVIRIAEFDLQEIEDVGDLRSFSLCRWSSSSLKSLC